MTSGDASALDQAIQRYGDDLYRLAVLLTPDAAQAVAALLQAVRRLADTPGEPPTAPRLLAALLEAAPRGRTRAIPPWTRAGASGPLLAALAQLPLPQRLALGLATLRSFEGLFATVGAEGAGADGSAQPGANESQVSAADHRTPTTGPSSMVGSRLSQKAPLALSHMSASALAADRRDALLALARYVLVSGEALPPMLGDAVPESCRPARALLALGGDAAHEDPAIRGHLALCAECRAAASVWREVTRRVEDALRAVLRQVQPPPDLAGRLLAAARREPRRTSLVALVRPWAPRALVPLAVVLAIVALVWPRGATEPPAVGEAGAMQPEVLVRRALDQLYAPPASSGQAVWQARYAMRWFFADASYADLLGTIWLDQLHGRHRVQLVHEDGGGPFEIQLGDGQERLWYSAEARYAASIYPQISDRFATKVELELPADEQERMRQARLDAGAWALPEIYLRQAATSELRSWGRRTAEDGADLAVLSFRGVSALGAPQGARNAVGEVTVLLTIDTASGALYEIRELLGPDVGEQTGRTVWRFVGGEWMDPSVAVENTFDVRQAMRSRSNFALRPRGAASPALPTVPAEAARPLAGALDRTRPRPLAPTDAPPGTTSAALIAAEDTSAELGTLLYLGDGRRMAIRTLPLSNSAGAPFPLTPETEELVLGDEALLANARVRLRPGPAQRYEALIEGAADSAGYRARISALGFSRDELRQLLPTLAPLSIETVRRQSTLFLGSQPEDPAAFSALLDALAEAPLPPAGQVRHTTARVFARQAPGPDMLRDPYHLPPYSGQPETLVTETWTRAVSGGVETASISRAVDGTVYARSYSGPRGAWAQDVARGEVLVFAGGAGGAPPEQGAATAERLLACGAHLVELQGGARAVLHSEDQWRAGSCALPLYPGLVERQASLVLYRSDGGVVYTFAPQPLQDDPAPFLADLPNTQLRVQLALGPQGRVTRVEVSITQPNMMLEPTAVERWELAREEVLPAERVPAEVFRPELPGGLLRLRVDRRGEDASPELAQVTMAQARMLLGGVAHTFAEAAGDGSNGEIQLFLKQVILSTFDPDRVYSELRAFGDPFEGALHHGAALRFEYALAGGARGLVPGLSLYQGRADRFGAYLQAQARWMASEPLTVKIDGREAQGWLVTTFDGRRWALVESDGLLLALPADGPEQLTLMQRLVRA
jgi:hypothetical protein